MGKLLFDKYSLLHVISGMIFGIIKIDFMIATTLHSFFELVENSDIGMKILSEIKFWPGGKKFKDTPLNVLGDTISFIYGWLLGSCF